MAGKGGARPGAGRKKGSPNRKSRELQAKVEAEGVTPLAYLLSVMRSEANEQAVRIDAAKAAAPFVHAKLSSVELGGEIGVRDVVSDEPPTEQQWSDEFTEARH